jgi:RNA polymerase sigma factor (TIGR02999 family)
MDVGNRPISFPAAALMPESVVTTLLDRVRAGDTDAFRRLIGALYHELRTLARAQRRRLGASDTVNTTALVHEVYAKLDSRGDGAGPAFVDRAHFFRIAAHAMRDVIVDYARAQRTAKRGGQGRPLSLDDAGPIAADAFDPNEVLSLDDALRDLHRFDEESARVAELRYFGGLTVEETAEALELSTATVQRRWTVARAWLYRRLTDESTADDGR